MADNLVPCPGGCGRQLHRRAAECPECGFRAELTAYQELLGSLSTVSSILVGFGLASLVQLAAMDPQARSAWAFQIAVAIWIFASLTLLLVLVAAEVIRRQEVSDTVIALAEADLQRFERRCQWLVLAFVFGLALTAAGVVTLGFAFSLLHGGLGVLAVFVGLVLVLLLLR